MWLSICRALPKSPYFLGFPARRRLGFAQSEFEGRELSTWINNELVKPTADHVVNRGLDLLRPLGIQSPAASFRLPEYDRSKAAMVKFVLERGLGAGFAIINTGAGWPSKLWPADRYAAVARHLGATRNLRTIVAWAGEAEWKAAHEIIIRAGGFAQLVPPTSLTDLAELARRARIFIGSDTGPLHIAAAVGTPCVGLYGPMPVRRCGPFGSQHIAIQNTNIAGKLKNRRTTTNETMLAIVVDDVCAACDAILSRRKLEATFPGDAAFPRHPIPPRAMAA